MAKPPVGCFGALTMMSSWKLCLQAMTTRVGSKDAEIDTLLVQIMRLLLESS